MKSLAELTKGDRIKELLKHPRHKMLDELVKGINLDRRDTKYKPLTVRVVAIKTAHLGLDDMHFLLKKCQQSHSFGKMFFGLLKVKPTTDNLTSLGGLLNP